MNAAAMTQFSDGQVVCPHPNEVDCKRIERAIAARERYRYVSPSVYPTYNGYRIESPCCSRNIDASGGVIDIARLEYLPLQRIWVLYRKDHQHGQWESYAALSSLSEAMDLLKSDPLRTFWP